MLMFFVGIDLAVGPVAAAVDVVVAANIAGASAADYAAASAVEAVDDAIVAPAVGAAAATAISVVVDVISTATPS